jgi:hypothetical protein
MPLSSPLRLPLRLGLSALAARRGGVPEPAPPVNVSLPSIIGTPAVGSEVTANQGGWTGYPSISYTYQWRRDGVNISGATAQTYTIQAADYETSLTVVVSATNTEGGPVTATSPAVSVIGVAPVNTVAPVVSGGSGLGDVLTTTTGTWTGYPASFTYAYQWQRNGSNIGGATASTYTIVSGDSAASITCLVTATNAEGSTAQASNGITAQTFTAPVISGVPTISGTAEVGQLLTASAASVTGNPSPSRTWQWLRDGSNISGATSSTYTLVSADGGTDVSVRQTETNALGVDDAVSAVVEVPASGFDPVSTFGSDLVTWYGNSVDDLWRAQAAGGAVTLYQDNAGSTPVTAPGQTVGRVSDLSGNNYHLTQGTASKCPLLVQRTDLPGEPFVLRGDGVGNKLATSSFNLGSTDKVTVFSAASKASDAVLGILYAFGNVGGGIGAFRILAPAGINGKNYQTASRGTSLASNNTAATYDAGQLHVLTQECDIAAPFTRLRINGVQAANTTASQGTGNYSNFPLEVLETGANTAFNGDVFSLPMIVKRIATAGEVADAEKAFGKAIGVLQ